MKSIKVHIESTLNVPHHTLIAFGISAAITLVVFSIFYTADTGIMGIGNAEAKPAFKPCC